MLAAAAAARSSRIVFVSLKLSSQPSDVNLTNIGLGCSLGTQTLALAFAGLAATSPSAVSLLWKTNRGLSSIEESLVSHCCIYINNMIRISELVKSKGSYHFHRATELKCTFRSVRLKCESRNSSDTLLIHKANVSLEICESPLMSFWLIKKSTSCLPKTTPF